MNTDYQPQTDIYVGSEDSDKRRAAKAVAANLKHVIYSAKGKRYDTILIELRDLLQKLKGDEQLLIIEDAPQRSMTALLNSLFEYRIRIERAGKRFQLTRPRTIIIPEADHYELPNYPTYLRRFSVVKFPARPDVMHVEGGAAV